MTRMSLVPMVVALALVACDFQHTAATVQWGGYTFQEVRALAGLPPTIKSTLGVGRPGLDGVADRGQSFNVTDMVDDRVPMRRLLSAGRDGDNWIVAIERGGRGYSVEVFLFSAHEAAPKQTWVLRDLGDRPTTLAQVVQQMVRWGHGMKANPRLQRPALRAAAEPPGR